MKNRTYSFSLPFLMDGALGMLQSAWPLLAIRFGAGAGYLATISAAAQGARIPFCLGAGALSERVGRNKVIVPAALILFVMSVLMGFAGNKEQIFWIYLVIMPCIGAFYPALQAMIGDVSERGELRKNLGAFNMGWCIGGSIFAVGAGALLVKWQALPFIVAGFASLLCAILTVSWARSRPHKHAVDIAAAPVNDILNVDRLLLIARMGNFLAFFGYTAVRILYPRLATDLGIPEATIPVVVSMTLVGQGAGMLATSAGGWWRGKLWPQIVFMAGMMAASVAVARTSNQIFAGFAFFVMGFALAVIYTGALYYGLQSRKNIGKNTGIHESLVAGGNISGSLFGGIAAEMAGLRAPYVLFAALCALSLTATSVIWAGRKKN